MQGYTAAAPVWKSILTRTSPYDSNVSKEDRCIIDVMDSVTCIYLHAAPLKMLVLAPAHNAGSLLAGLLSADATVTGLHKCNRSL